MEQKKKHPHSGHRQRVKDKAVEAGIEHWPYHEVLELMLMYAIPQKDVNPLAHTLIEYFGSFSGVLDAGYEQLRKINGIGDSAALFLSLIPEFLLKYSASKNTEEQILDLPYKCVNYFRTIDTVRKTERFYIFCLNNKKQLVKTIKLNSDFATHINLSLPEIGQKLLFSKNKSIVILHTHPSGDSRPTRADVDSTMKIIKFCLNCGIKFDDHVIITEREFFSFRNSNFLEDMLVGNLPQHYYQLKEKDETD